MICSSTHKLFLGLNAGYRHKLQCQGWWRTLNVTVFIFELVINRAAYELINQTRQSKPAEVFQPVSELNCSQVEFLDWYATD